MTVEKIDHTQTGIDSLPSQWGDQYDVNNIDFQYPPTRAQGLLQSWLEPLQEAEDTLISISESFNLYTAIGAQLDILGDLRNVKRNGRDDTQYRQAIITSISASSGSGTIDEVTNLLSALTGGSKQTLWEHYPLGYILYTNTTPFYLIPTDVSNLAMGGVDGEHVVFDPNEDSYAPADVSVELADLVTTLSDNIVDDLGGNIQVAFTSEAFDLFGRSSFPDSSESSTLRPLPVIGGLDFIPVEGSGYGNGYGLDYGGT